MRVAFFARLASTPFALLFAAIVAACGSSKPPALGGDDLGGGGDDDSGASGGSAGGAGGSSGFTVVEPTGTDGGACPAGLTCNVSCTSGTKTTITGKVYDPAGRNPLYDIVVYVPAKALTALPKGVPTGAAACSCPALYESGEVVTTTTAVDGTFTLTDAP